jgi:5-methylcytosine-specific restriction enzyme subunit McrC
MAPPKPIRVFEYQNLYVEGHKNGQLTEKQFNALVKYNQKHDSRFFTVIFRGIKFKQYVGVIQVGNLTIEVLPKADRDSFDEDNKDKWQKVLLDMLKACRLIKINESSKANLLLRHKTLLDLYINSFLSEVEKLTHEGLVKSYRQKQSNRKVLAGQINFLKQISINLIHKERFYVKHQTYDRDHLLHQVLQEALLIIPSVSSHPGFGSRIKRLESYFIDVKRRTISKSLIESITYSRKTEHYRPAIKLAKLLLLNYNPDIKGGSNNVLAILFDMNVLFEEYVFRQIRRAAPERVKVSRQAKEDFWETQTVRPDIVIQKGDVAYVLDTKWKVLWKTKPSDSDLKQMYVYHHYFKAKKTFLVYPEVNDLGIRNGRFHMPKEEGFECELRFLNLLDGDGGLNDRIGWEVLEWVG